MWFFRKKEPLSPHDIEHLRRRDILSLQLLGVIGVVVIGCKTRRSTRTEQPIPPSPLSPTPVEGDKAPSQPGPTTPPVQNTDKPATENEAKCTNLIDISPFPEAKENLEPRLKLYGESSSTLLVIDLPKYVHGNLISVFVVRQNGEVIAQKGISSFADIKPDLSIRPLVFDNLSIKNERRLSLIFETSCNSCDGGKAYYKYQMTEDLVFETKFNGKPVYGLMPTNAPLNFYKYQAFADFLPQMDDFDTSSTYFYQVLSDEAKYDAVGGLNGFIITDLFGNILSENGKNKDGKLWADIMNHHIFICYRLVADQFYVRTFIRLS